MTLTDGSNQANGRLKAVKFGLVTGLRGDRLYLRATLPPKPHIAKDKPYQQRIYLGVRPTSAGVQYAEKQARLIGAALNLDRFDWSDSLGQSDQIETTSEWVTRFEED